MTRLLRLLFVLALLAACPAWAAYTDNGDGTITDTVSGLMWDKCSTGQTWDNTTPPGTCTAAATTHVWAAALGLAVSANASNWRGHNDWRLPNRIELESLVDLTGYSPSINTTAFPSTVSSGYWSSTVYTPYPASAWGVNFNFGFSGAVSQADSYYVRLVRSGQLLDSFDAQGDIAAPVLSAAGVSATTATATTLAATSNEAATGYWIVVAQGSAAPTAAQVKAGTSYGAVTVVVSGNGAMTAATAKNFSVTGLSAATAYDLYLVAEDVSSNRNLTPATIKVQFSTAAAPVNGACGGDNGLTLTTSPTSLCATGSASAVTSGTTNYTWNCNGSNGGTNASCSATRNYVVTSSVNGGNGSISASQTVAYNATPNLTLTPNAGYTSGPVAGTCGGALVGNSYTTSAVNASCTVVAGFSASVVAVTSYTAPSATGTGSITASFTGGGAGCGYTVSQYIPLTGHAASPPSGSAPAGVSFPHGLFDFTVGGCTPGATLNFTITYPQALAVGTVYWKYGPTSGNTTPHWYQLPAVIAGNTATFSITDGGLGDDDLTANGTIVDQGGPGGGAGGGVVGIPTLSEWALLALIGMMGLFGMRGMTRKPRV